MAGRVSRKSAPVRRERPAMGAGAAESIRHFPSLLMAMKNGRCSEGRSAAFGSHSQGWTPAGGGRLISKNDLHIVGPAVIEQWDRCRIDRGAI